MGEKRGNRVADLPATRLQRADEAVCVRERLQACTLADGQGPMLDGMRDATGRHIVELRRHRVRGQGPVESAQQIGAVGAPHAAIAVRELVRRNVSPCSAGGNLLDQFECLGTEGLHLMVTHDAASASDVSREGGRAARGQGVARRFPLSRDRGKTRQCVGDGDMFEEAALTPPLLPQFESVAAPASEMRRLGEVERCAIANSDDEEPPSPLRNAPVRSQEDLLPDVVPNAAETLEDLVAEGSSAPEDHAGHAGDGLDSNGTIEKIGGDVTVFGPTANDNGALDSNGGITVSGGTLVAIGSGGMAESPDAASPHGWLAASVSGSAGSTVHVADASGAVIASYTATKSFASVVFSSAGVVDGQVYTVTVDGVATTVTAGEAAAGGMGGGMGGGRP